MRLNINELKKNKLVQRIYNLKRIFSKELWKQLFKNLVWKTLPKCRHVNYLAIHLKPLPKEIPNVVKNARDGVFKKVALGLKNKEDRETLSIFLNECRRPNGIEHIFFSAIYPFIRKRNLIIIHHPTDEPGRMDVELAYEGHSNEYIFWRLEIDGTSDQHAGKLPIVRRELIDNHICPIYHIGAASIFDRKNISPIQLIINAQNIFVAIHEDLKKNGFRTHQPEETMSTIAKSKMKLIDKWLTIKNSARKKAKLRR